MDEDQLREQLEAQLSRLDWTSGITKAVLLDHLAGDQAAHQIIKRTLADGVYFSAADVVRALPADAPRAAAEPPPADRPAEQPASPAADEVPAGAAVAAQPFPPSLDQSPVREALGTMGGLGFVALIGLLVWLVRRLFRRQRA